MPEILPVNIVPFKDVIVRRPTAATLERLRTLVIKPLQAKDFDLGVALKALFDKKKV